MSRLQNSSTVFASQAFQYGSLRHLNLFILVGLWTRRPPPPKHILKKIRIKEAIGAEYMRYSLRCYCEHRTVPLNESYLQPSNKALWFFSSELILKALLCHNHHTHTKKIYFEAMGSANLTSVCIVITHHICIATTKTWSTIQGWVWGFFFLFGGSCCFLTLVHRESCVTEMQASYSVIIQMINTFNQ